MNFNAKIKNYIQTLSRSLPNDFPDKKQLLSDIRQNLQTHIQENPSASWSEITEAFGTPQMLAEALISDLPKTDIAASLQKKQRMHTHIFLFCILFVLLCIYLTGYLVYWKYFKPSIINEPHYIFDGTEVTSEEFERKMDEP